MVEIALFKRKGHSKFVTIEKLHSQHFTILKRNITERCVIKGNHAQIAITENAINKFDTTDI
jgi:hypothetical protein